MPRGAHPGERRGGRSKGTRNKRTEAQAIAIAESGITALDFLIGVMRDPNAPLAQRIEAAKAVAPYLHPRLSTITANVNGSFGKRDVRELSHEELKVIAAGGIVSHAPFAAAN